MARKRKAAFPSYRGSTIYSVKHPDHGEITVGAPDENAAIVAAANFWGVSWTPYHFYSNCEVTLADQKI